MAYNIGKSNHSHPNILQHQQFVPQRNLDKSAPMAGMPSEHIHHTDHVPQSPMYMPGQSPRKGMDQMQGHSMQGQGQGQGSGMMSPRAELRDDPRYGSAQGRRGNSGAKHESEVSGNQGVPPSFNLTHLNFDEPSPPARMSNNRRTNDLIDFTGNPLMRTSIGYNNIVRKNFGDFDPHGFKYNSENQVSPSPAGVQFDPRFGQGQHEGAGSTSDRKGGALLFIRFPVGHGDVAVAAQAFHRAKIHDVGGVFLGLAKKSFDFGYESGSTDAFGVFHFPSLEKATLFFQLDPIIRQPDFPAPYGHSQMFIVCNAYLPDNMELFNTFLLSEIELHPGKTKREFFETFQVDFEKYLSMNGVMPFVVCSYGSNDRHSLRRHSYPASHIVTCHLFQGLDHLKKISEEETYCKFRSLHNQMAKEKCTIFTLNRKL